MFKTTLAKSILPFTLFNPDLVVLPILIKLNDRNEKEIVLHSADELMNLGFLNASRWFKNAENTWELKKSEKSKYMTANARIDFQTGLSSQNLNAPFLVLYNSSGKDANSVVVERKNYEEEIISDYKTYVCFSNYQNEAYYIASILNSTIANLMMKDFQSRGLFGARDVSKKILDIYFSKFDETDETHLRLAELSKAAHAKAAKYLQENPPQNELSAIHLGRLRVEIKKHLSAEMKKIDKIVKKLVG